MSRIIPAVFVWANPRPSRESQTDQENPTVRKIQSLLLAGNGRKGQEPTENEQHQVAPRGPVVFTIEWSESEAGKAKFDRTDTIALVIFEIQQIEWFEDMRRIRPRAKYILLLPNLPDLDGQMIREDWFAKSGAYDPASRFHVLTRGDVAVMTWGQLIAATSSLLEYLRDVDPAVYIIGDSLSPPEHQVWTKRVQDVEINERACRQLCRFLTKRGKRILLITSPQGVGKTTRIEMQWQAWLKLQCQASLASGLAAKALKENKRRPGRLYIRWLKWRLAKMTNFLVGQTAKGREPRPGETFRSDPIRPLREFLYISRREDSDSGIRLSEIRRLKREHALLTKIVPGIAKNLPFAIFVVRPEAAAALKYWVRQHCPMASLNVAFLSPDPSQMEERQTAETADRLEARDGGIEDAAKDFLLAKSTLEFRVLPRLLAEGIIDQVVTNCRGQESALEQLSRLLKLDIEMKTAPRSERTG